MSTRSGAYKSIWGPCLAGLVCSMSSLGATIEIIPPTKKATQAEKPTRPTTPQAPSAVAPKETVGTKPEDILNFWFGVLSSPDEYPRDRTDFWMAASPEFGRQMQQRFEKDVRLASAGELNQWRSFPRGRLALILLLDQFPRHLYRNKPQSFANDAMAKGLVLEGIQMGDDKQLFPIERAFFYLPLQHAEDMNSQNLSVNMYHQLVNESPGQIRPQIEAFLRNALLHQQIIARFKRFPARNQVLGRDSTPEEIIYLNQRGSF